MGNLGSKASAQPLRENRRNQKRNVCSRHLCVLCDSSSPAFDDHLRAIGNGMFRNRRYKEALELYSAVIEHNSSDHISLTNRANTYMRLNQFKSAMADCRKALELVPESLKANYYLGQCLCELKRCNEGLPYLKKALEICRREGRKFEREIKDTIARWQEHTWLIREEIQKEKDMYLKMKLFQLIMDDKKRKIQTVKDSCIPKNQKGTLLTRYYSKELRDNIAEVEKHYDNILAETEYMFETVARARSKPEVPEYMCCKISLCMMENPVITPYGITYDRSVIEEHLRRGNYFDPTTREPLTEMDLIPNLALKEAIEGFLTKNYLTCPKDEQMRP